MVAVPAQYEGMLKNAATETGLPYGVVAAQVNDESGFDPSALSGAGAEGMFQFLPSTYTGLGFPAGTENDPNQEVKAYIAYMKQLLAWAGGDVRKALAAYNAGQGNWQAGIGYADSILSAAGQPTTVTAGGAPAPGGSSGGTSAQTTGFDWTLGGIPGLGNLGKLITGTTGSFATIGDAAKAIAGLVQAVNKLTQLFMLLFRPEFWLRVGAFLFGLLSLGAAVYFLKASI
jgi:hypothetical protein